MMSRPRSRPRPGAAPGLLGDLELRDLLQRVLRLSTAEETEAALSTGAEALTRFAHNMVHQNVAEVDSTLEVRAAFGRRVGLASTNDLSPAGLERVVAAACALARHSPDNADWPGLTRPDELAARANRPQPVPAYDAAVAAVVPETRARMVGDLCAAAASERLLASGALSTSHGESAVLNSHGLFAYAPGTEVELTFVVEQPGGQASAYGHAAGWRLDQLPLERLRDETLRRARARQAPRPVPAGEYPVVLEPYAVAPLLEALAEAGMGALAVQEERSWMNHRLGQPCFSRLLTIGDDAFDPDGRPQAFDCEGVPKQRVAIVRDGVPLTPVYDRLTASREPGGASTGHAQPYDEEDWDGPLPENLTLAPGDSSVEQLIAGVDRGLYVTRLWYVNVAAPRDCVVTGTTRDGVWWIERGELAHPVPDLRFDQSLVAALAGVRAVGNDRRTVAGYFGGAHRVPALALDSFRFIEP